MQQTTFIYLLSDGENVRYIGKANNPKRRFATHLRDSYASHKCTWVKGLLNNGITPVMEIVDEVPMSEWEFWEQHYISLYKSWGFDLVNMNEGGRGTGTLTENSIAKAAKIHKGKTISEAHRQRLSELRKGQKLSPERAAAFASLWKGKKQSDEHKAKRNLHVNRITDEMREKAKLANIGRPLTEDHKAKISPLGRKHSEDTKARIGASQKGVKPTAEALENQRKGQQKRWQKAREAQN